MSAATVRRSFWLTWGLLFSVLGQLNDGNGWEVVYRLMAIALFTLVVVDSFRDRR